MSEGNRSSRTAPLHELNPIGRFTDRAADYVAYRPTYPAGAIDAILDGLASDGPPTAADIGAGTGIVSRLLGDRGVRVLAVEPGAEMRGAAAPHPNVTWFDGRAEATGLPAQAADLVVCAQSFHWFRADAALAEFARLLRPSGRLAIMWNRRSRVDPLTAGFRQAILDVGGEIAVEQMDFDPGVIAGGGDFLPARRVAFPNLQRLDLAGLIGRARSASYVPKTGAAGERLLELLRGLHARHADADGYVTVMYETEVYLTTSGVVLRGS